MSVDLVPVVLRVAADAEAVRQESAAMSTMAAASELAKHALTVPMAKFTTTGTGVVRTLTDGRSAPSLRSMLTMALTVLNAVASELPDGRAAMLGAELGTWPQQLGERVGSDG